MTGAQQEPWPEDAIALRDYFEALLNEHHRATALAEQERERAASALRETLREQMRSGDIALERHIDAQVESVKLALASQEKFATEVQRAAKEAVEKALASSKEIAHKHNELIQQQDRDKEKFATKIDLLHLREVLNKIDEEQRASLPREVFDRTLEEWTSWRNHTDKNAQEKIGRVEYEKAEDEWREIQRVVDERLNLLAGQREGVGLSARTITGLVSFAFIAISLILVIGDVLTP